MGNSPEKKDVTEGIEFEDVTEQKPVYFDDEKGENNNPEIEVESVFNGDVEFEDPKIDIDSIEDKLKKEAEKKSLKLPEVSEKKIALDPMSAIDTNYKKYVIYVEPENVDYIESLSIHQRKKIINSILKEEDKKVKKERAFKRRAKFFKHLLIASITFIIGIPTLYIMVNKSVELTIESYKQSQKNFENLYREKGKLQNQSAGLSKYKY